MNKSLLCFAQDDISKAVSMFFRLKGDEYFEKCTDDLEILEYMIREEDIIDYTEISDNYGLIVIVEEKKEAEKLEEIIETLNSLDEVYIEGIDILVFHPIFWDGHFNGIPDEYGFGESFYTGECYYVIRGDYSPTLTYVYGLEDCYTELVKDKGVGHPSRVLRRIAEDMEEEGIERVEILDKEVSLKKLQNDKYVIINEPRSYVSEIVEIGERKWEVEPDDTSYTGYKVYEIIMEWEPDGNEMEPIPVIDDEEYVFMSISAYQGSPDYEASTRPIEDFEEDEEDED